MTEPTATVVTTTQSGTDPMAAHEIKPEKPRGQRVQPQRKNRKKKG